MGIVRISPDRNRWDPLPEAVSGSTSIRVLIADDHAVVRAGFQSVCESEGLAVVGLARNNEEILQCLRDSAVDVILLDVRMESAIAILPRIQEIDLQARVIALAAFEPDEQVCGAVEAGAVGFLLKDSSRSQIVEAIETVYVGEKCLPFWILARIAERRARPSLSQRELEVLEMVSKGLTNKEIAHAIQLSHFTVRNHVRSIIDKLDVGDRTEAATLAIQRGILTSYGVC
jgi:two-component system, NarL family, response regulator